jgi:surfeit locus 1 family protein
LKTIPAMLDRLRQARLIWPTAFSLAGLVLLIGLGVWQLERLQWKQGLLAKIEARVHAAPMPLDAAEQLWRQSADVEYLHVRARGHFLHDKERYIYAPAPAGLGWHVYTPLEVAPGRILWVNRGWVDDAHKAPARRPAGQVTGETEVAGLARGPVAPGLFAPVNNPGLNHWYWPDLPGMTGSAFGAAPIETLPFRLEADRPPAAGVDGAPQGGVTRRDIPNNHLQYAVTWFGLAATLIGVYFAFAASRLGLAGTRQ